MLVIPPYMDKKAVDFVWGTFKRGSNILGNNTSEAVKDNLVK